VALEIGLRYSFILETYIAPLQETRLLALLLKGAPSPVQREDHSMLMDPQPKRSFAA